MARRIDEVEIVWRDVVGAWQRLGGSCRRPSEGDGGRLDGDASSAFSGEEVGYGTAFVDIFRKLVEVEGA